MGYLYYLKDYVIKREISRTTNYVLQEATDRQHTPVILLTLFGHHTSETKHRAMVQKSFSLFEKCQNDMWDNVGIHTAIQIGSFLPPSTISFYAQANTKVKIERAIPHIPAYTPISSSLPIVDPKEFVAIAIRILKLYWNVHMEGLVFVSPCISDLVWAGTSETIQLVSVGLIRPVSTINHRPQGGEIQDLTEAGLKEISSSNSVGIDYRYSSPEHTGRTGNPIDSRSDIYSLGVMLYLIATGSFPFTTSDPLELLHAHMTTTPPDLPEGLWTDHTLSKIITNVIHKMMRKSPKDRYQGLYGIIRDLESVLHQFEKKEIITIFQVGNFDGEDIFRLPHHKLYGREKEIENTMNFFVDFNKTQENPAMIAVGGHSGVGKSSFLHIIFEQIFSRKDLNCPPVLLSGKHDRIKHTPYSAMIDALGGIVKKLLGMSEEELEWWAAALQRALRPNAQVLVDVIPEVTAIIGPQPSVPVLAPIEAKIRFERAVVSFVQVFTTKFCAILFLDDMQWTDAATIKLLDSMVSNTTMTSLLVVCAYRDNEVGDTHPFRQLLDELATNNKKLFQVKLAELSASCVASLIMDACHCSLQKAQPFAELVYKKTNGNPFFVHQLMRQIVQDKLVKFDYKARTWQWSLEKLDAISCADNIVEFMIEKIKKMPVFVQNILQHASCLGNTFQVSTLTGIAARQASIYKAPMWVDEDEEEQVQHALHQGVQAGLIYQTRIDKVMADGHPTSLNQYKYVHDRVQEAFYEMMEETERVRYHIAAAEYFNGDLSRITQDTLFTIAHHYNAAIPMLERQLKNNVADQAQIQHIVRVYFEAAKKAKQSTAVESACQFLANARRLMPKELIPTKPEYTDADRTDPAYVFVLDFLLLRAECEASCGENDAASRIIEYLLDRGRCVRDRVRVCILNIVILESSGNFLGASKAGLTALELLETPIQMDGNPLNDFVAQIDLLVEKAGGLMVFVEQRPPCSDLDAMRIEVLANMLSTTYISANDIGMNLFYAVCAVGTKLSLERGLSLFSASLIACYAALLTALRLPHAFEYAQMSMACLRKYPHPIMGPRNNHYNACFTLWQGESMKEVRKVFIEGFKGLAENGDTYAMYTSVTMITVCFADNVDEVESYFNRVLVNLRNMKSVRQTYVDCIAAMAHCFGQLRNGTLTKERHPTAHKPQSVHSRAQGSTPHYFEQLFWGGFEDGFDELAFVAANDDNNGAFFSCFLLQTRMKTSMLFGNFEFAETLSKKFNPVACADLLVLFEWEMLNMIILAAKTPVTIGQPKSEEQRSNISTIKETRKNVKFFEKSPCLNGMIYLVDAELARIESETGAESEVVRVKKMYDKAIQISKDIPSIQGFANELAMKYCLSVNDTPAAANYLAEAKAVYAIYGAHAKLQLLEANYKELAKTNAIDTFGNMGSGTTAASSSNAIDFVAIMKACQVISSEVNIDKMLCSMIKITQQSTGAQKALFIVPDEAGKLFIEAYGDSSNNIGTTHRDLFQTTMQNSSDGVYKNSGDKSPDPNPSELDAQTFALAVSIVQYVRSTKHIVLLDDAANTGNFAFDTHVQAEKVKSVLCVPIVHQSAVVGILYFENNLLPGAFSQDRVQIVQLLSGQLAVSYQNAILFKTLQLANQQLEQKNKALVEFDQMKDQFLANTSHELRTPLNGIIGLAEYLVELETNQSKQDSLAMIATSGRRLANLVNDILDISALRAGTFHIRPRPTDLNSTVKVVTDLSFHLLGSKEVVLTNFVDNLPVMNVDEGRLQQVLQNIIGNAIKFTSSGYVKVTSMVTDEWVDISVEDTGCGIAEEDLGTIFEEFKQINGGINREVGGTGLGLSIAKKMVEMHQGRILVESTVGKGSTFVISLPASRIANGDHGLSTKSQTQGTRKVPPSPLSISHIGAEQPQQSPRTITILSVDDEPVNQIIMQKLLGANFNVIQASNGQEALDMVLLGEHPPDFVLLDVMMPHMSGLEVCEKIREKFPMCDLPVIMVSARGKPENIAEGLSKGANDYITKPINKNELLARIRLQISICLSCKMLCEKNHNHTMKGTDLVDLNICEGCKHAPSYPGQKSLLLGRRNSKVELLRNILDDSGNVLEVTNSLPLMVTIYDVDGAAVTRNREAAFYFSSLPQNPNFKNSTFLPCLSDRNEANALLTKVNAGNTIHHTYDTIISNEPITIALCARMIKLKSEGEKTAYIFVGEQRIDKTTTSKLQISHIYNLSPRAAPSKHPAGFAPSSLKSSSCDLVLPVAETRSTSAQTHDARLVSASTQTDPPLPPPSIIPISTPTTPTTPSTPPTPPSSRRSSFYSSLPSFSEKIFSEPPNPAIPISPFPNFPSFPSRLSEATNFYSADYIRLTAIQATKLNKWIHQLTSELALAHHAQKHALTTLFFRLIAPQTGHITQFLSSFYHTCRLPTPPTLRELVQEVAKRGQVEEKDIWAIVKDDNVLVAQDDDITPDLRLDIYLS